MTPQMSLAQDYESCPSTGKQGWLRKRYGALLGGAKANGLNDAQAMSLAESRAKAEVKDGPILPEELALVRAPEQAPVQIEQAPQVPAVEAQVAQQATQPDALPPQQEDVTPVNDKPTEADPAHEAEARKGGIGQTIKDTIKGVSDSLGFGKPKPETPSTAAQAESTVEAHPAGREPAQPKILLPGDEEPVTTWADDDGEGARIVWVWNNWVARGFAFLLVGYGGSGKSMNFLYLSGVVELGWPWPDGAPYEGDPGKVVWVEGEAAQNLNRARAKALGLPLDGFINVHGSFDDANIFKPKDQDRIRRLTDNLKPKFIFMDSLSGVTGGNENKSEVMTGPMKYLAELARDTGVPVLASHPLKKPGETGGVTLQSIRGSTAIGHFVRGVWWINQPNPAKENVGILSVLKTNLGVKPQPIGFEIYELPDNPNKMPGIKYSSTAKKVAPTERALAKAAVWLDKFLGDRKVPAEEVKAAAKEAGVSESALEGAKNALRIKPKKDDGVRDGKWRWFLPDENHRDAQDVAEDMSEGGSGDV
ncbi:MAG: AAA family ATPase [Anaerolineales bacterium]|jgi:hypothetical protein